MSRALFIEFALVALFGVALALRLGGVVGGPVEAPPDFEAEALATGEDEFWTGIYVGESKAGYSVKRRAALSDGGQRLRERTLLRLAAFGTQREIRLRLDARLDSARELESFTFVLFTDPVDVRAEGRREGEVLRVQLFQGETELQSLDLDADTALPVNLVPSLVASSPSPGTVVETEVFDPTTLSERTARIEVVGRETVPGLGRTEGLHLRIETQGVTLESWVDERGETLREEGLLGMVTLRETREDALSKGWNRDQPPDLISLSAVPIHGVPIQGRDLRRLRVRVQGAEVVHKLLGEQYGDAYRDQELELVKAEPETFVDYVLPASEDRFAAYLQEEALIETGDARLVQIAADVIHGDAQALLAAERLTSWVFKRLIKTPVFGVPGALATLDSGQGDCNEHTALYTALARTAGLPTRVAAGIVWSDSLLRNGAFYYHAWPEVWLGAWIPVDPTFGQYPADPTHIRLVVGSLAAQTELVGVIGNLEIEVLEAE
jgi:hypothetical protein